MWQSSEHKDRRVLEEPSYRNSAQQIARSMRK
jgi:hypothetical protein